MSLDIYVQPEYKPPKMGDASECVFSFEDEGYYWSLYPLFEKLWNKTGRMIDLYDYAAFQGEALDALARTVADARELAHVQPESWEVVTGIVQEAAPREIRATVERQKMLLLLDALEGAILKARESSVSVTFWGD